MSDTQHIYYKDINGKLTEITGNTITITPAIVDLVIENDNENKIKINNGERIVRGNSRAQGLFIVCLGLWMLFAGIFNINNFLDSQQYFKADYVNKMYSSFNLPANTQILTSNNNILATSNNDFTVVLSGEGTIEVNVNSEGFNNFKDKYNGEIIPPTMTFFTRNNNLIVTHFGVYFIISEIISPNDTYLYGAVKCQMYLPGLKKDITTDKYANCELSINHFTTASYVLPFIHLNTTYTDYYLVIPFANRQEYLYASGISDVYTKVSLDELKNKYNIIIEETNVEDDTNGE